MSSPRAEDAWSATDALRILSVVLLVMSATLFVIPHPYVRDKLEAVLLVGLLLAAAVAIILLVPSVLVFLIPPAILIGGTVPIALYVFSPAIESGSVLLGQIMPMARVAIAIVVCTSVTLFLILGLVTRYTNRYCAEAGLRLTPLIYTFRRGQRSPRPKWGDILEDMWKGGLNDLVKEELMELAVICVLWGLAAHPVVLKGFELVAEMQPGLGLHDIVAELGIGRIAYTTVLGTLGIIFSIHDMSRIQSIVHRYALGRCVYHVLVNIIQIGDRNACALVHALDPQEKEIELLSVQLGCGFPSESRARDTLCAVLLDQNVIGGLEEEYYSLVCLSGGKVRKFIEALCSQGGYGPEDEEEFESIIEAWDCRWYQKIRYSLGQGAITFLAPLISIPFLLLLL